MGNDSITPKIHKPLNMTSALGSFRNLKSMKSANKIQEAAPTVGFRNRYSAIEDALRRDAAH